MAEPPGHEVTDLPCAWSQGDERALKKLVPIVHDELHRLARVYMANERPGHTLQATALVNEAYLRLLDVGRSTGRIAPRQDDVRGEIGDRAIQKCTLPGLCRVVENCQEIEGCKSAPLQPHGGLSRVQIRVCSYPKPQAL